MKSDPTNPPYAYTTLGNLNLEGPLHNEDESNEVAAINHYTKSLEEWYFRRCVTGDVGAKKDLKCNGVYPASGQVKDTVASDFWDVMVAQGNSIYSSRLLQMSPEVEWIRQDEAKFGIKRIVPPMELVDVFRGSRKQKPASKTLRSVAVPSEEPRDVELLQEKTTEKSFLFNCDSATAQHSRLEFVHIPKTGGSFLETLALRNGVSWGACHNLRSVLDKRCPLGAKTEKVNSWTGSSEWHTPLGIRDQWPQWAQDADLFMVVRNPYDRIVSEWNYVNKVNKAWHIKQNLGNATLMNAWLQEGLQKMLDNQPHGTYDATKRSPVVSTYYQLNSHFVPQADYWVPGMHVLRSETLYEDLTCLLPKFGLNWDVPSQKVNPSSGKLTAANLTLETRKMIEEVYKEDFRMFGYKHI